ncbi:DUF349 domain-containing protein [Bdellovibrionota bacterium FG-1]
MANLFNAMSSLFERLKGKARTTPLPQVKDHRAAAKAKTTSPLQEADLRALDKSQLEVLVSQQPERVVIHFLRSVTDQDLQLRVIEAVTDESTLKRVSRSELSKKVKRVAERKLRQTGAAIAALRLQEIVQLNEQIQRKTEFEEHEKTHAKKVKVAPLPKISEPQLSVVLPEVAKAPEAVSTPQIVAPPKVTHPDRELEVRQRRLAAVEGILGNLKAISEDLAHPKAGPRLRELQKELGMLRRWRREYPAQLDEAEEFLKALLKKRSEVVDEALWDTWARTDRATRIQAELEKLIGELEAEPDSDTALKNSIGLTQRLFDYAKEMRDLGGLDREKDHKIWEQFKALSDRGWVICDRMRLQVFERLKTTLSEHVSEPLVFTAEAITNPSANIQFKISAFEPAISARVEGLQALWREIGGKNSEAIREVEIVFTKLIEMYFRQLNLYRGQLRRVELNALQIRREILFEMKAACEGQAPLLARLRLARKFEETWKKTPLPESVAAEYQTEFETYQASLKLQFSEEMKKHVDLALGLEGRLQALLEKLRTKNETHLPQAMKSVSAMENELQATDKHLSQFQERGEATPVEFQEIRSRLQLLIQEYQAAATKEIRERVLARNQVILEAEVLALSSDWEASRSRFEAMRELWKKIGVLGQGLDTSQDASFSLLFENVWKFYLCRIENKESGHLPEVRAEALRIRKDLIYSLEALIRFREAKVESKAVGSLPLPFSQEERAKASGKLLEFGLKFKHVLSLDPQGGIVKETKKIMDEWSKTGAPDDEYLSAFWKYYLDRVHTLLDIHTL